jgi:hypothetical protein
MRYRIDEFIQIIDDAKKVAELLKELPNSSGNDAHLDVLIEETQTHLYQISREQLSSLSRLIQ